MSIENTAPPCEKARPVMWAEESRKRQAAEERVRDCEKRNTDLEILAEKWCEHECLASTCDDCPLEGKKV